MESMIQHLATYDQHQYDVQASEYDVQVEMSMVASAHTVIDPWAMMVKPLYTPIANVAMTTSLCPKHLTLWTDQIRVELF